MNKLKSVLLLILALSCASLCQTKLLTIDDIFSTDPTVRVEFSGNPDEVEWSHNGSTFRQEQNGKLMRVDAVTGNVSEYFDSSTFIRALVKAGIAQDEAEQMANSPTLHFNAHEAEILLDYDNDLRVYDRIAGSLKRLAHNKT